MIRLAQLYTGGVGSEIIRRLEGHPRLELVAVLVHSDDKAGRDSGELVGAKPNGVITTQSIDEVIATRPDAAIYSGMLWDVPLITRLLREGINVYTGMGGYFLPGQPEFDEIDAAGKAGNASFAAGGNIPGLISDVFPLFVTGYTGRIRLHPRVAAKPRIHLPVGRPDTEHRPRRRGRRRGVPGHGGRPVSILSGPVGQHDRNRSRLSNVPTRS